MSDDLESRVRARMEVLHSRRKRRDVSRLRQRNDLETLCRLDRCPSERPWESVTQDDLSNYSLWLEMIVDLCREVWSVTLPLMTEGGFNNGLDDAHLLVLVHTYNGSLNLAGEFVNGNLDASAVISQACIGQPAVALALPFWNETEGGMVRSEVLSFDNAHDALAGLGLWFRRRFDFFNGTSTDEEILAKYHAGFKELTQLRLIGDAGVGGVLNCLNRRRIELEIASRWRVTRLKDDSGNLTAKAGDREHLLGFIEASQAKDKTTTLRQLVENYKRIHTSIKEVPTLESLRSSLSYRRNKRKRKGR